MGVRGTEELLAELPSAAAEPLSAIHHALDELLDLRHACLDAEAVLALGETCERLTARVAAARLAVLAAMTARHDVLPDARVGQAAEVFGQHVLGHTRARARRDAHVAGLLRPDAGDLPRVGAGLRDGDITPAHVDIAVRTHRELGAAARDTLVPFEEVVAAAASSVLADDAGKHDPGAGDDLAAAFSDLLGEAGLPQATGSAGTLDSTNSTNSTNSTGEGGVRQAPTGTAGPGPAALRQVLLVDAVLAHYARSLSVAELDAVGRRIVDALNPKEPSAAHERRYLHMSQLLDGSWVGRFECGNAHGVFLKSVLAAFSAPRPGVGTDADGTQHPLRDDRDLGARQLDALLDLVTAALAKNGITLPTGVQVPEDAPGETSGGADSPCTGNHDEDCHTSSETDCETAPADGPVGRRFQTLFDPPLEPDPEGEYRIIREPGVLAGPLPLVELIVPVGIEHLAAACVVDLATRRTHGGAPPLDVELDPTTTVQDWLRGRPWYQPGLAPNDHDEGDPSDDRIEDRDDGRLGPAQTGNPGDHSDRGREAVSALGRALSPYAHPARVEHAGRVDPATLRLLTDCAQIRMALLNPDGAVLHLGRAQRLVSPAQKRALTARDGGCVIPGCTVTADACQAHHVTAWADGGTTDIENLALVCLRHHVDITTTENAASRARDVGRGHDASSAGVGRRHVGWEITMIHGVPWVRPPSWINPSRPLLRNAVHHFRRHCKGAE